MHAVLLDRDGTLSLTGGYCHPDDFRLAPWAGEAIRLLNQRGLPVAVVTSQTGIAHGKFTVESLNQCFARMIDELAQADVIWRRFTIVRILQQPRLPPMRLIAPTTSPNLGYCCALPRIFK